jgi:hypothetical protein
MKSEWRRNVFDRLRGRGGSENKNKHGAKNQGAPVSNRRFIWLAVASRRSWKSPFRHARKQRGLNPPQCCACERIGSTGSLLRNRVVVWTAPNAIFRQEFFDSPAKIKFRFFLVGFARGF